MFIGQIDFVFMAEVEWFYDIVNFVDVYFECQIIKIGVVGLNDSGV